MIILLIGKGGREHALAWKLSQTAECVYVLPGNPGTAALGRKVCNLGGIDMYDFQKLVIHARRLAVDLVIPGPDYHVVAGIGDVFTKAGIPCFAPSEAAAMIEGSKIFAKCFMHRHNIPTAVFRHFDSYHAAENYLSSVNHQVVIKVSGLAAGKGVVLPESSQEAKRELRQIMIDRKFGRVGREIVIEERLLGQEISLLTFSDGRTFQSLPPARDHKRLLDGSKGPNTGGMGAYASKDLVSEALMAQIEERILRPTFRGLREEGRPFRGMLFTGIMITPDGPKVLEYNARFGDPETQTLLPLLDSSTDLASICLSCTQETLSRETVAVKDAQACSVVVAAEGYPGMHREGDKINMNLLSYPGGMYIFHSGTEKPQGSNQLETAGGRVFTVSAVGSSLQKATDAAYKGVRSIEFPGKQYRQDIGTGQTPEVRDDESISSSSDAVLHSPDDFTVIEKSVISSELVQPTYGVVGAKSGHPAEALAGKPVNAQADDEPPKKRHWLLGFLRHLTL